MKTTDLAMIFVAILLPIIIVVYVQIATMQKKEEQTLYYTNIINSAIADATYAMKNVEGEDQDVDYGYSGTAEKRVTVNARVAVDTFYKSLYDNFEITGDKTAEDYIKSHIPALGIIDYNGIYIYSLENYINATSNEKEIDYVLKPKRYFTYSYGIKGGNVEEVDDITKSGYSEIVTVIFTMDDYIGVIDDDSVIYWFYLEDEKNNYPLYTVGDSYTYALRDKVIQHLKIKRSEVISKIVSEEMSFAVSNHNLYSDVDYEFTFPAIALSQWEEMIDNVGIIAFLQGINIGNEQLDYVAHGISGLKVSKRFLVSLATTGVSSLNYYHATNNCEVYRTSNKAFTGYYTDKVDAATDGYYPCPTCKP